LTSRCAGKVCKMTYCFVKDGCKLETDSEEVAKFAKSIGWREVTKETFRKFVAASAAER